MLRNHLFRIKSASASVTEGRVTIASLAGPSHFEFTPNMRSCDVVEKIYRPSLRARGEVHFKAKFRIMDHYRVRAGDCSRKHLVACIDQRALLIVDNRR